MQESRWTQQCKLSAYSSRLWTPLYFLDLMRRESVPGERMSKSFSCYAVMFWGMPPSLSFQYVWAYESLFIAKKNKGLGFICAMQHTAAVAVQR